MQHHGASNSSMSTNVYPENLFASVVLGLCFILGVPGNIAVMVRLAGWLKRDSFTPKLMLSLAVSDLLILLPLPMWIWDLLDCWIFGLFLCKFLFYMVYVNLCCSNLCVILLSVQRYMQVLHCQTWAKLGRRGKKILVIGMWMLSGVLASHALVEHTVSVGNDGHVQCESLYLSVPERVASLIWENLMFLATFLLLTCFYFHLYRGVSQTAFFKSNTMTKLVIRIVVTFFILWLPCFINNMVIIAALLLRNHKLLESAEAMHCVTEVLPFINSCVNPFLYAFSALGLQQKRAETENT